MENSSSQLAVVDGIERFAAVRGYSLECDVCKVTYNGGNGSDPKVPYRPRGYRMGQIPSLVSDAIKLGWTGVDQHFHNPFHMHKKPPSIDRCPACSVEHLNSLSQ